MGINEQMLQTIYVTIQGETDLMCQNGGFHFFPEFCSLNP